MHLGLQTHTWQAARESYLNRFTMAANLPLLGVEQPVAPVPGFFAGVLEFPSSTFRPPHFSVDLHASAA